MIGLKSIRDKILGNNYIINEISNKIIAAQNPLLHSAACEIKNTSEEILSNFNTYENKLFDYMGKEKEFYKNGSVINVAILIQHQTVWNSLKSVYLNMKSNERFNVSVVLLPFVHSDSAVAKTYLELKEFFINENIPFLNFNYYSLQQHNPHIVFVQNPYEETRYERFRAAEILKCGAKICYIPYGLEVGGGMWNIQAQFNLEIHNFSWKIFTRSDRHKLMYAKYCDAGNSHVIVTGHPKFDNKQQNIEINERLLQKINGKKVILWTPHFSVGNPPSWATYNIYSKTIFDEFAKREDLFLYVRPHPLFFKAMINHGIWKDEDAIAFKNMLLNSKNMALDENVDYLEAFEISDALMADAGSFLLEYLPSSKPILYLHHPEGLGLYDESTEELYYKATGCEDIINFIDMVANSEDLQAEKRKSMIPEYLYGLDGNVGKRIVDHIIEAFDKEDFYSPNFVDDDNLQKQSIQYWKDATSSFLAPEEYYKRKESILEEVCKTFSSFDNAIDIGCGNGTFTFILAKYFKRIQAYDVSYGMIVQAREEQMLRGVENIEFTHAELKDMNTFERFSLVSCMEVTSTIPDDMQYLKLLGSFKMLIKDDGYLLLVDSLSLVGEQVYTADTGYVAKYRNISDYKTLVEKFGFRLIEEQTIKYVEEKNLTNNLFIFKNVR